MKEQEGKIEINRQVDRGRGLEYCRRHGWNFLVTAEWRETIYMLFGRIPLNSDSIFSLERLNGELRGREEGAA